MSENGVMTADCPKCRHALIYVTSVPHPKAPEMQRTTFVCYPCNRTWSYALSPAMAQAYAAASAHQIAASIFDDAPALAPSN